jgi:membrane-associated phospholipid phosphatase
MDTAAVHGGAMPSSHTAVALIVLIFVWRHSRFIRYPLAVIFVGLMVGCVWGRFHYVSDVIVGDIIGVGAYLIAIRILPNGFASKPQSVNTG